MPLLQQGTLVVMDNASFHRKEHLNNIAQKYGIRIIFLLPYSPELNPIRAFLELAQEKNR